MEADSETWRQTARKSNRNRTVAEMQSEELLQTCSLEKGGVNGDLYSSGIFCRDSPQFDDLFGFSVDDVLDEVKRGSKLICSRCKKKGATAGCEVKRCKKSYHYPCAILEGAKVFEDSEREYFWLYCSKHQQQQEKDSTVNGCASSLTKPGTSKNPSEAGPSKFCLTCERTEGNISLESVSNRIMIVYCAKHTPKSQKRNTNGDSSAAGPSACSSDSNSSSSIKRSHTKRPLSSGNKRGEPSPKRTPESWSRILTDDSSEPESDIDGSVGSQVESQLTRNNSHPTESASGNHVEDESKDGNKDDDETDVESESLLPPVRRSAEPQPHSMTSESESSDYGVILLEAVEVVKADCEASSPEPRPVHSPDPHTAGPSAPQQSSTSPPPSPNLSRPCSVTRRAISPAPPETVSPPAALPSDPEPSIDSTSFWKSCNVARCTQAIFTDFINEMNSISSRIQSDQASQEDYDLALRVMEASGKLAEHVAKQQKELQRKQTELQKAAAAMKEVVSALRR
ncbi:flocculation protein FLO11 isoform X3 [Acanthopagrus latus]|uniref:flocculation protein FLO11 isoform X3 n=1 Tax=Acanthopagrus latus TaxID=8177 RepID=UPI00187BD21A|nr:flocculation protein FLO11 isoform X3 [Acanthopagrus latus]